MRYWHRGTEENRDQETASQAQKKTLDQKEWREAVVIATGPSLSREQVARARLLQCPTIAVNDAWRLAPWADVLYATDSKWWRVSAPQVGEFYGEKWSSHSTAKRLNDDKTEQAAAHGLKLVEGESDYGFCFEPGRIHYGRNSGFAAINLALQFGARRIWLLGFDMHHVKKRHFFGDHPPEIAAETDYRQYIGQFDAAARMLPEGIEILNATPNSAINCFPRVEL